MGLTEPALLTTAAPPAVPGEAAGKSALPVDPWRLAGGLWKRRFWILILTVLGIAAGCAMGFLNAQAHYQVTVQLIKREIPSSFRVDEAGEAFHPPILSVGTLIGTATSPKVLRRVVAKSEPKVSLAELRDSVVAKDLKNTDFLFLTLSGSKSAQATVDLANLWAAEVVNFTREMQSQDSRDIGDFLQKQVDNIDDDLHKLNAQIFQFSKEQNLIDVDKQTDAYLRTLGDLELKCESSRIDLETIEFKITGMKAELQRQSPIAEKLRSARTELQALRSQYTDRHPLIIQRLETIQALESQLKLASEDTQADPSIFAGSTLGNTLYLELVQYENEKKALTYQKEQLEKLREEARAKVDTMPEKAAAFGQLKLRKQALETARTLLSSRLKEAQLFEDNSRGYYSILTPASLADLHARGKLFTIEIFTVLGGILLFGGSTAAALVAELLDPKLRTGWEAARAFHGSLLSQFKSGEPDTTRALEIWSRWIAAHPESSRPRVVWTPCPGEEEAQFWQPLFECAARLLPLVRLVDCAPSPLKGMNEKIVIEPVFAEHFSIPQAHQLGMKLQASCRGGETVWIRIAGPVQEPLATLARCGAPPLVLVCLNKASTKFWRTQGELMERTVGPPVGIVAMGELPWKAWK
jgi:uncharacterized protein involved in exopolysaccharide biosynthesis